MNRQLRRFRSKQFLKQGCKVGLISKLQNTLKTLRSAYHRSAYHPFCARVFAAFRAAALRSAGPLVCDACFADALRSLLVRCCAAVLACFDKAAGDAAAVPSFFCALIRARLRVASIGSCRWPFSNSRSAFFRVFSDVLPLAGAFSSTPARRASLRPIAIACLVLRAPVSPLRILSISAFTNSPACVLADLPCCLSRLAFSIVSFVGINNRLIMPAISMPTAHCHSPLHGNPCP